MEERGPPPPRNIFDYYDSSSSPFPSHRDDYYSSSAFETPQQQPFHSGTYVVQVPKDQVYRVPPPEHAAYVEQQRRLQPQGKRSCWSCSCVFISTFILLLVLAIIGGLSFVLIKKDNPNIRVDHFLIKNATNSHHHHTDYDITLGSENPNHHTSLFYGENGDASLSFKSKEIATGKYPVFDQVPGSSTSHQISLHGSNVALPKEIGHSMNSTKTKVHIDLSLQVKFPVKMKVGPLVIKSKMVRVLCSIKVDTLAKHTHILSQDCQTME